MSDQIDRDKRIISELNLNKLPFKTSTKNFFSIYEKMYLNIKPLFKFKEDEYALKWCLSTNKRMRVFLIIFEANEEGYEVYKESIASQLSEFSYKTVAQIIDDGMKKGYYLNLAPRTVTSTDKKIRNIRPSEELVVQSINWSIDLIDNLMEFQKKLKKLSEAKNT
ncbi:hypothetical protein N9O89_01590 [Candidatus Pelagibacter sp.]|nr:hypothetical protein [Candidatus Pelagibacter sp.]